MRDELSPDREFVDEFKLMTDGVWIWPSSYPHYDAEIPPLLAELAASRNWEPPTFHEEEFEDRMPFSD
ncbi:hypothetical protein [Streptomyces virginiae]|uniref:hypothetical protein n=1 Tax=Streptomyces virginiae TaxID=1961 RepID=UPI0022571892|nr:hypothetical protein [Streptomyces virginiae]MCX4718734.1 hypothetical protein [Streptomyces virginiae]MCX5276372.1 hypothetical protein [Streptomyces virginiae]